MKTPGHVLYDMFGPRDPRGAYPHIGARSRAMWERRARRIYRMGWNAALASVVRAAGRGQTVAVARVKRMRT